MIGSAFNPEGGCRYRCCMTLGHSSVRAGRRDHTHSLRALARLLAVGGLALSGGLILETISPAAARPAQRAAVPAATDCAGRGTEAAGSAARWSDAGALALADGRGLAPEGIALPTRLSPDPQLLAVAADAAASVLDGCAVAPVTTTLDRHGRLAGTARLVCPAAADARQEDLATALVRAGVGYATAEGDTVCATQRLSAEAEARIARRGIWSLASAVAPAGDEKAMAERRGLFSVTEGRVLAVGGRDRIFLNFGASWKQDFTVMLTREDFATILGDRLDPAILRGALIQVRGVVREEGGPAMAPRRRGEVLRIEGKVENLPDAQALPSRRRER
ncbi:hypothetical protein [Xanthobacter aminoxidans]|uniref:hypothetical protein n=1 Tax=Xanthobacter aminoxidans TaxID=186280 RepID=UPI002023177A|nr:hypothetical protein [Xanthobacter aminoxidans]MCL8383627.1 hypothetical protein [Xanthobacter aminoxidans]